MSNSPNNNAMSLLYEVGDKVIHSKTGKPYEVTLGIEAGDRGGNAYIIQDSRGNRRLVSESLLSKVKPAPRVDPNFEALRKSEIF